MHDRLDDVVPDAYASAAPPGALVLTAGTCPLGENEVIVGDGDVRVQARQAVVDLAETLAVAAQA